MNRKLGDGIACDEMHLAGRLHLFHGIVPLSPSLIHLLGGGILHSVLFVLVSGYKPDHLSRAGNYSRMQVDKMAVGQDEFVESDGEFTRWGEICVESAQRSCAVWDWVNRRDPAGRCGADGNDEMVEDANGLHNPPGDRLADLPNPNLLIKGDL